MSPSEREPVRPRRHRDGAGGASARGSPSPSPRPARWWRWPTSTWPPRVDRAWHRAKGGRALAVRVDVSEVGQVRDMVQRTAEAFGSIEHPRQQRGHRHDPARRGPGRGCVAPCPRGQPHRPLPLLEGRVPLMRERVGDASSTSCRWRRSDAASRRRELHGLEGRAPRVHPSPRLPGRRARHQRGRDLPRADAHRDVRVERSRRGNPAERVAMVPRAAASPPTSTGRVAVRSFCSEAADPCAASPSTWTAEACSAGCHGRVHGEAAAEVALERR